MRKSITVVALLLLSTSLFSPAKGASNYEVQETRRALTHPFGSTGADREIPLIGHLFEKKSILDTETMRIITPQRFDIVTPPAEAATAEVQILDPETVKKIIPIITAAATEGIRAKRIGHGYDIAGKTGTYRPDSLSKFLMQRLDVIAPPTAREQSRETEVERATRQRLTSDNAQPVTIPLNGKTLKLVLRFKPQAQSNQ